MDLPIHLKLTFINMRIDFENLLINDLSTNGQLNLDTLENLFGNNLYWNWIEKISVNNSSTITWIWSPSSTKTSIVPVIYDHLNGAFANLNPWKCSQNIWKLCIVPQIKIFI